MRVAARVAERLIALAVAALLLRSAFAHSGNAYYFLSTVYSYQVVGIEVGKYAAAIVPFLQITIAVCLLIRWWVGPAYLLSFATFSVFVAVQVIALRRGLEISCGCFGASESLLVGWVTLTVAGSSAAASLLGLWLVGLASRASPGSA